MQRFFIIILKVIVWFLFVVQPTSAQTYEEFVRQHNEDFSKFKAEQQQLMNKLQEDYREWVKEHDAAFQSYLEQEWKNYRVFAGKPVPEKPKPLEIPVFTPPDVSPDDGAEPINQDDPNDQENQKQQADIRQANRDQSAPPLIREPAIRKLPVVPPELDSWVDKPVIVKVPQIPLSDDIDPFNAPIPEDAFSISFCGAKIYLDVDRQLSGISISQKGKPAITHYWKEASKTSYTPLVNQLMAARDAYNINDFGYYMLIETVAESLYPMDQQQNERLLFSWYMMLRSGYDVKMAYNNNEIAILIPTYNTLYGKQYITLDGINYFLFSPFVGNNILTYDQKYDAAHTPVDFAVNRPLAFGNTPVEKTLSFQNGTQTVKLNVQYDPGVITFFEVYPQVDPDVYFNAAVSRDFKESLSLALKPLLVDMSEPEAINFLLRFVQNAFNYKTDPEQFNREKFFFAEEVIYYPASDCEDRSVLFSWLVRELLGMKVVGLEYPGHMATAVHFSTDMPGDFIEWQGEKYTLADATYINAPFGRTMPTIGNEPAIVIPLNNSGYTWMNRDKVWAMAEESGVQKANYFQSMAFDQDGNAYFTGYFNDKLRLGSKSFEGVSGAQNFVVASITKDGKVAWADHIPASGNATGLALTLDRGGDLYLSGSFSGKMAGMSASGKSDLFMARYALNGTRKWIQPAGLDSLPPDASLTYSLDFTRGGKKQQVRLMEYNPTFSDYGLFVADNSVVYTGITGNTLVPAEISPAVNSTTSFDYSELLKKEYDKFVRNNIDPSAAGLFAIASLIRSAGIIIPGKAVQQAFDRYNPSFKHKNENFYENIGKISFLRNANNIISIVTENGKDIVINKMKVSNHAQIRISVLSENETVVEAIDGIRVGKLFIWYDLNTVKVYSKTGNMVFDYDDDHTQSTINIRKDILN